MPEKQKKPTIRCPKSALILENESNSPRGRGIWDAIVPAEHTIEDVLKPEYFGMMHTGKGGLRERDIISIEPESALWMVQVRVMSVHPTLTQVRTREMPGTRHSFAVKPPAGYRFVWEGNEAKWVIYRGDVKLDAGFSSQDAAYARIADFDEEEKTAA